MDTLAIKRNVWVALDRNIDYYGLGEEERRVILSRLMSQMR